MADLAIPCVVMRGGTTRGLFFRREDLSDEPARRDRALVAAVGGPDPRQVDGLGGADLLLSKVVVLWPGGREGIDVEVTFGSAAPGRTAPAYGANCGNLISAVALYAVEEGLVSPGAGPATVRMYNTDSRSIIEGRLGEAPADLEQVCRLAGMPASGSWVELDFLAPSCTVQGKFLPTGRAVDVVRLSDGSQVQFTLIDCGALYAFVPAGQFGLDMARLTPEIQHNAETMRRFESVRSQAAVLAGLVDRPADALARTPAVPKLALVGPPADFAAKDQGTLAAGAMDLTSRIISTQEFHQAYAVTGAIATAAAAAVQGSVVAQAASLPGKQRGWTRLRIGHPTGVIACSVHAVDGPAGLTVDRARIGRTARRVMAGKVLVPDGPQ